MAVMLTRTCNPCGGTGLEESNETLSALDAPRCRICEGRGWLFTRAGAYVYVLYAIVWQASDGRM